MNVFCATTLIAFFPLPQFHQQAWYYQAFGPNLVLSNWRFWVPVEMLFFAVLPPELLVPATCLAALCWNMILSTLSFRSRGERPAVALIS